MSFLESIARSIGRMFGPAIDNRSGPASPPVREEIPVCPSCGTVLAKVPQRKTKCKHCGEFIFVKSTPENRTKTLMTASQADAAEQSWQRHNLASTIKQTAEKYCVTEQLLNQALIFASGDMTVAVRTLLTNPAMAGDRQAAWGMMANADTGEERMAWQRQLMEIDLEKVRRLGFRSVQLSLGNAEGCSVCRPMNQEIVSASTPADVIIKSNCERLCRERPGLCDLMAHAALKRPDGTTWFDRD